MKANISPAIIVIDIAPIIPNTHLSISERDIKFFSTLSILIFKPSIFRFKFFSTLSILVLSSLLTVSILTCKFFSTASILMSKLDISFCKFFSTVSIFASKLDISFCKFFSTLSILVLSSLLTLSILEIRLSNFISNCFSKFSKSLYVSSL
uniref:REP- protein n=1 Tax=Borreliella burgdorferi TaxID=139 RepID=Q44810_BORBG|nr:minus strand repeat motif-containing gene [Borreliella burgdorferi 297]